MPLCFPLCAFNTFFPSMSRWAVTPRFDILGSALLAFQTLRPLVYLMICPQVPRVMGGL